MFTSGGDCVIWVRQTIQITQSGFRFSGTATGLGYLDSLAERCPGTAPRTAAMGRGGGGETDPPIMGSAQAWCKFRATASSLLQGALRTYVLAQKGPPTGACFLGTRF